MNINGIIAAAITVISVCAVLLVIFLVLLIVYYSARDKIMQNISYERSFSEDGVFEGESCVLTETISNKGFLPLFGVIVESYFYKDLELDGIVCPQTEALLYNESRFNLLPYMQIKRRHNVKCLKRGFYALESANIVFFKSEKLVTAGTDIYVYPKIVPIKENMYATGALQGDYTASRRLIPDPFNMSGIREYLPGDSFNMINFKATAKSAYSIKVNNYDYSSSRTVAIYMNFQMDPENTLPTDIFEAMMERGLSYVSALVRTALDSGSRVGYTANCNLVTGERFVSFAPANSRIHLIDILREMAMTRISEGVSFISLLDQAVADSVTESEIYIVTSFVNEEISERASRLVRQGNTVRIVELEKDKDDEKGAL